MKLTYPENHPTWLTAMGITPWQQRNVSVQNHALEHHDLPDAIVQSRYWLVGESLLTQKTAYLLAGMMKAIGAQPDQVVYSTIVQGELTQMATGFLDWPQIKVQPVSATSLQTTSMLPDTVQMLFLGEVDVQTQALKLPSLESMLEQTDLKRDAWRVLKTLIETV